MYDVAASASPQRTRAAMAHTAMTAAARTPFGYVSSFATTPSHDADTSCPSRSVADELAQAAQDDACTASPPSPSREQRQQQQQRRGRCDYALCYAERNEAAVCALAALQQRHAHLCVAVCTLEQHNAQLAHDVCVARHDAATVVSLSVPALLRHVDVLRRLVARHARRLRRVYVACARATPVALLLLHDPLALQYERQQQQQQCCSEVAHASSSSFAHYRKTRYPVMDAVMRELGIEDT